MHFLTPLVLFAAFLRTAIALVPGGIGHGGSDAPATFLVTPAEMEHWLATTNASLTYIGGRPSLGFKRNPLAATVTFCTRRAGNVCGGDCTVFTGDETCVSAPDTQCMAATSDVYFCTGAGCVGGCSRLSRCANPMGSGFCYTPGVESVFIPFF